VFKIQKEIIICGVSKNADLEHYFLPDFWALEKLSKMPVMNGLQDIIRGPKIGQRKIIDLDSLNHLYNTINHGNTP
jgi:hypothetical protein